MRLEGALDAFVKFSAYVACVDLYEYHHKERDTEWAMESALFLGQLQVLVKRIEAEVLQPVIYQSLLKLFVRDVLDEATVYPDKTPLAPSAWQSRI